jgi:hypothetical protein
MKYKNYIIAALLVVILVLSIKQCNTPKIDLNTSGDTLIKHTVTTIRDTTTIFKIKENTVFEPIIVYKNIDTNKYKIIPKYRVYNDTVRDSNVVIYLHDTILGYLTSRNLNYKLLVPLKIYDSTTIIRNNNIKYQINLGLNTNFNDITPSLGLIIRNNGFYLGYDLINKRPNLGYKYTIFNKR